jgi:uncharacterized repeat protein (TIGR01451 family)
MVRLADGTVFSLYSRLTSAQSPKFGYYELGSGFTGRLNTANTVFDDDTDLQVTISSGAATVNVGQNLNYAVAVKNAGSGTANNAYATVALPSQYKINSIPSGCSVAGQALTCSLGNVGAGQTKTLAINVSALSSGATTATAYASSDSYDYAPGDSVAGVDVNVQAPVGTDTGDVPTLPEWGAIILGLLLLSISYFAQIQPRTAS